MEEKIKENSIKNAIFKSNKVVKLVASEVES